MGSGKMMDGTLKDGFEWLLEQIYHNYEELQKRVNEALEKLKNRQAEERIRRQHHLAATVSSSTTSDEQINDAGTAAVPVAVGAAQHDEERKVENELINHSIIVPSQKAASTNQITNSKTENVGSKRKRYLRNTIHPKANLPPSSIDSARMKNPQIFVVKTLTPSTEVSKKTTSAQTDGIFDMNGYFQSTEKPVRITQFVPLTVLPKMRPKCPRPLRRTDSI